MRTIQTDILVIGGGATGTGVLRDLGMRGFKSLLVEKRDLTHGTTGRYHGLLHSGGRYVVKDPQAAKECIKENRILRNIMPHCIEDTGGFFVITPFDDPGYAPRFIDGCSKADIPIEELSISRMLQEEPLLNPKISRCFRVPDASADSFLAAHENVNAAKEFGADTLTYHKVQNLLLSGSGKRVVGAQCRDLIKGEDVVIYADLVINASGAWAGLITGEIGIDVNIIPGKGTMIATNHRIINTVINRCKLPSDGDILVPTHTVSVIGTTDVQVNDPDRYPVEPWEIRLCLEEGEKLVPGFKQMRMLRAWAGVRPLYQERASTNENTIDETRDITRTFVLLDHEQRDGISGLITITSGKWTTYRKMAEVTVDLACEKFGTIRECRTHLEPLPGASEHPNHHYLGARLGQIEKNQEYGQLICECELSTHDDVVHAIMQGEVYSIDDIRRDIRLGMGPCQGGFCTYRVTGILHNFRNSPIEDTNLAFRDFIQERWKGILPILWGKQLQQLWLDELIFLNLLNIDHLPGPKKSDLTPSNYEPASSDQSSSGESVDNLPSITVVDLPPRYTNVQQQLDALVIGAGLSGLISAWRTAAKGARIRLVTTGWGSTHLHSGCIDVFGYDQLNYQTAVESPFDAVKNLITNNPKHPYSLIGLDILTDSLNTFKDLCVRANYPFYGSLETNWMLPTATGSIRPTCLAPEMMIAGDIYNKEPMLLVGFNGYFDFFPQLVAENLKVQGIEVRSVYISSPMLQNCMDLTTHTLANLFEQQEFLDEVAKKVKPLIGSAKRVGFPAILGINNAIEIKRSLETKLNIKVFEIPTIPPSIPGIRIHNILLSAIKENGGRVYNGMQAIGGDSENGAVTRVSTKSAARYKHHYAKKYILATGGILGGGIHISDNGYAQDMVFNLPVTLPQERSGWFSTDFLSSAGHTLAFTGIETDTQLRPVNSHADVLFQNVHIVGSNLPFTDPVRERSLEGIALSSGFAASHFIDHSF